MKVITNALSYGPSSTDWSPYIMIELAKKKNIPVYSYVWESFQKFSEEQLKIIYNEMNEAEREAYEPQLTKDYEFALASSYYASYDELLDAQRKSSIEELPTEVKSEHDIYDQVIEPEWPEDVEDNRKQIFSNDEMLIMLQVIIERNFKDAKLIRVSSENTEILPIVYSFTANLGDVITKNNFDPYSPNCLYGMFAIEVFDLDKDPRRKYLQDRKLIQDTFENNYEARIKFDRICDEYARCRPELSISGYRTDPDLIEIIESMEKNPKLKNLMGRDTKVLYIPDAVQWEINEYRNYESIVECHRTWR